jgi:hypothetical protein
MPGQGVIHFPTLLSEASKLHRDTPLMLEHLSKPEEYAQAAGHVRSVAAGCGLAFG